MNSDNQRPKGLSTLPTSEVVLAPEFLDGVKKIAPKPKRSKLWIVLLLAIAGAGGFFAWKRFHPRAPRVDATASAPIETTPAPIVTASVEPVVVASASATAPPPSAIPSATTSASAAPTSKVRVRRRGR